ncbi:hypothetical protein [Streptomyces antarcticus]|uniref:hypothetical protein n=1 Tax=Streptomyces antarcticus TaxID=2996458 RepID=UPI00226E5A89|nr:MULTISPECIES: hypothetical protein [unclassified Streptomyces]MCY0942406.1 hypothetical protein [Streptomyces sp. H34-AA3]MCZ4080597.1 hypothetical protein [Streptomyces sp. H34-S5]
MSRREQHESWDAAVRRATDATAAHTPGGMDENCWDDVAMRGILAVVLYSLHLRENAPIDAIRWQAVLWQLRDDQRVTELATSVLAGAGHDLDRTAEPGDPVADCWRWLRRTWNPHAPRNPVPKKREPVPVHVPPNLRELPQAPELRWGGMTRGIGAGLPDPALEVCTDWAAGIVQQSITADCHAHHRHDRVAVISGAHAGRRGYVAETGWHFDDATETVEGPAGYVVDLDDVEGTERIDADGVTSSWDLRWPHRPQGSLKDAPPPGLHDPLPPAKTSAEDLAEILGRAADPAVVPQSLRSQIAAAHAHHHLELDRQARPNPGRVSWQVFHHWYQLTKHYADDQRADLFEIVVTRHLHDTHPVHHLTLSEENLPDLIARYTASG